MQNLEFVVISCVFYTSVALEISWDNSAEPDLNNVDSDSFRFQQKMSMPNWFFIFPGTKWCGAGNIAETDEDFGTERDTDKCCRNHDYCPDVIEGYQTKYNLTNPNFFTRLHCNCDEEFRTCLKSVNTKTSKQVGQLYFTAIGTQCYKEEFPITGCLKYTYFPTKKCLEYTYDYDQRISYQWFDLPNF